MSTIYDALVTRKHIVTGVEKHCVYQAVADDLTMAVFQVGQRFYNDQWDIRSVFVANSSAFSDEHYEWKSNEKEMLD